MVLSSPDLLSSSEQLTVKPPELHFKPVTADCGLKALRFQAIWIFDKRRITNAFCTVMCSSFTESQIDVKIQHSKGNYSHAGRPGEPMILSAASRDMGGTLVHELVHRWLREYGLEDNIAKFGLQKRHQLLDLFYFDIMKMVYGEKAAKRRVEHEKEDRLSTYYESWDWYLGLKEEEKKELKKKILNSLNNVRHKTET